MGYTIKNYKTHKRFNHLYISLDDIPDADFFWSDKEVINFDILWNLDTPISEIAKMMKKSEISILLLSFDRVLKGKVKSRSGWKIW